MYLIINLILHRIIHPKLSSHSHNPTYLPLLSQTPIFSIQTAIFPIRIPTRSSTQTPTTPLVCLSSSSHILGHVSAHSKAESCIPCFAANVGGREGVGCAWDYAETSDRGGIGMGAVGSDGNAGADANADVNADANDADIVAECWCVMWV